MYFYITSSIGSYQGLAKRISDKTSLNKSFEYKKWVKVGIANDTSSRFEKYHTINPKLVCAHSIELNKTIALNLEDAFKRYLSDKRVHLSECYYVSPKQALFFTTRCLTHLGLSVIGYETYSNTHFKTSRVYYLDSIYFGKKIPLFEISNNVFRKKKGEKKLNSFLSYEKIKDWNKELEKKYFDKDGYYFYSPEYEYPTNFSKKNILYRFMSDFDDYIKRLLENINSSEDFLVQNPFKEIDSSILTLSTKIFDVVSKYYYFFSKNKKIKKHFFNDIKFLDTKIKETEESSRNYCLNTLRKRKIIAFDYIYDEHGSAGKQIKNDPYQINQSTYYFRTRFNASNNNKKKLLEQ